MVAEYARVYGANVPGETGADAQGPKVPQRLPGRGDRPKLWLFQLRPREESFSAVLGHGVLQTDRRGMTIDPPLTEAKLRAIWRSYPGLRDRPRSKWRQSWLTSESECGIRAGSLAAILRLHIIGRGVNALRNVRRLLDGRASGSPWKAADMLIGHLEGTSNDCRRTVPLGKMEASNTQTRRRSEAAEATVNPITCCS